MWARIVNGIACLAFLTGCEGTPSANITIVDGDIVYEVSPLGRTANSTLQQAGIVLAPGDLVLNRGYAIDPWQPFDRSQPVQLQVRRAVEVQLNGAVLVTAAASVGEALMETGVELGTADMLEPGATSPLSPGLHIRHVLAQDVQVFVDGQEILVQVLPADAYDALAGAGLPVIGLDYAWSVDSGGYNVDRISESLSLVQESIPFEVETRDSPELELGTEQILQAGLGGLQVTRTRTKYQDGNEILRAAEEATVVRPPQDRIVVRGTKIVDKTTSIDGITINYWRAIQMYATVYSPCNSGTADGSCSTGTASGLRAGKGVVAVDPGLYAYLNGQRLYIPGYGFAVVGDVGGGYIIEQNLGVSRYKWIDLGFDDNNIEDMSGWITVYFLSPAPLSIPDVLK